MMPYSYQYFQVEMPCGHVYEGEGPKRDASSSRVPYIEDVTFTCFCGAVCTIETRPILMVVGYEGRAL